MDEVVIKGADLSTLSATPTPIDRIHVFRWNGQSFEAIPFQINEVQTWQLVSNVLDHCPVPEFDPTKSVCETSYAFNFATGTPGNDEFAGFDRNDELVFMARDAGLEAPSCAWLPANVADTRYGIVVADEKLEGGVVDTKGVGWVYVFKWNESHAPEYGDRHYVEWDPRGSNSDPDRDEQCRGIDPVIARRLLACGWSRANASSTSGQSSEPTVDLRYIGNWTINRLRLRAAGNTSTPYPDLIDRFKFRMGTCPFCETEEGWDTGGCGRFIGLKKYDPVTRAAPIHTIRMMQGALSGFSTTRVDRFFGTHLRSRIRLRVHSGVGPLRFHPDFLSGATPMNLWTASYPANPPVGQDLIIADVIDGHGSDHNPPGSYDASGASAFNWNQFDSPSGGRFLVVTHETRPLLFTEVPTYYYGDVGSGAGDSPEFQGGQYGNAGVKWNGVTMNMQDEECDTNKPDDENKLWTEVEVSVYALAAGRYASTYVDWLARPLRTYSREETRCNPLPPPSSPCKPTLSQSPTNGFGLNLSAYTTCPEATSGYALYRAVGVGSFSYLTSIRPGESWLDRSVRHGTTYRYVASPFNADGVHGPPSDEITATVIDSFAPLPPTGIVATPLSHGARIEWQSSASFDVVAYDVYASLFMGGPYQKLNSQPIAIPTRTLTATTLEPGQPYYVVLKAIDSVGNQSAYSDEVVVTPLP